MINIFNIYSYVSHQKLNIKKWILKIILLLNLVIKTIFFLNLKFSTKKSKNKTKKTLIKNIKLKMNY